MKSLPQRIIGLAAVVMLASGCGTLQTGAPNRIVIGVQAAKPEETRTAWLPLAADMGKKLGIETDVYAASQTDTVDALKSGKADVVWLSSSAAIDAVTDANAEAFALYYNVNGTNGYKGVVITRADSGIKTLDEALTPGKYIYASGAKTSTSGYVLPQYFLFNKRNTSPEQLFKSVIYGGHFPNLDALWAKKVDVAVNNTTDLAAFQARTPEAKNGIVVLWESPLVPNDVLMVRKDAPEATKRLLRDFFLSYGKNSEAEKEYLKKASGIAYFVPTSIKLLEPVSEFKFATERSGIEQNAKLSAEEKTAQMKALDARVAIFKKALAETR
ncbi:MAG: phosphate/phosphite/phosphonate ABC transporter substrate-binding protein [candidate division NC10 bacterium]|nr:phosphate/phosphite/phosphonate ABC transporter substrate-binding protein [candidate division NC10 bacterium]